ncbi:hypothetical protein [Actinoplanes solisilvae]|uniref:hypothetical protein n=1 Tax=Actinoplanes solisilvae TaxID=2486853 RepID=UPI001F0BA079|nr:hypothetical protein [Actinoplanes solisilvae]
MIDRRLVPLLVEAGYVVGGMTRSTNKTGLISRRPGTYNETGVPADPRVQIDRAAERTVELLDAPSGIIVITD